MVGQIVDVPVEDDSTDPESDPVNPETDPKALFVFNFSCILNMPFYGLLS